MRSETLVRSAAPRLYPMYRRCCPSAPRPPPVRCARVVLGFTGPATQSGGAEPRSGEGRERQAGGSVSMACVSRQSPAQSPGGQMPARPGAGVDAVGGDGRTPRVIAVVVNYNGGAFLGAFLESFRALAYANAGLVVVDNASADESWRLVPGVAPDATLLRSPTNAGFTGGANHGVREALRRRADYVLFLNGDTRLDAGLIEALLAQAG